MFKHKNAHTHNILTIKWNKNRVKTSYFHREDPWVSLYSRNSVCVCVCVCVCVLYHPISIMIRVFANSPGDWSSISAWVSKDLKNGILDASLHYKV